MARAKEERSFLAGLASVDQYKRTQGRLTRRLTLLAVAAIVLLGCWRLTSTVFSDYEKSMRYGIPAAIAAIGLWAAYRLVNWPKFADFLIAVEGEMDKVSWASQTYLIRATGVVFGVMVIMAACLLLFDFIWQRLFQWLRFLRVDI